jgi:pimeloyl-ACP methyl ester carboxylesterase
VTVEDAPADEPEGYGSAKVDEAVLLDEAIADIDWTRLPDGAEHDVVEAPSGPLATLSMGRIGTRRVLLVPGVTGSKEDFALMLPLLAAAGYRAESFDMAGQYESASAGPPAGWHYDHELFVRDLLFMLERDDAPVHVLGYSFAGTVAQLAYAARPELFASLTLLSCPPQPGQGFRGVKRLGRFTGLTTGRVGAALMIWGVKRNFTKVPPGRLDFVHHRFRFTNRRSVRDIISLMKRAPDLRAVLAAAPIPKLVAVGEHDLWPLGLHAALAEEIGARLAVYRTGHSPCETAPHQLVRDLLALYR